MIRICVLVSLKSLKYMSVAGCHNVDDWCLDRLVRFRDTLMVLDVSRCPLVTERGLATLHKLQLVCRLVLHSITGWIWKMAFVI